VKPAKFLRKGKKIYATGGKGVKKTGGKLARVGANLQDGESPPPTPPNKTKKTEDQGARAKYVGSGGVRARAKQISTRGRGKTGVARTPPR